MGTRTAELLIGPIPDHKLLNVGYAQPSKTRRGAANVTVVFKDDTNIEGNKKSQKTTKERKKREKKIEVVPGNRQL